MNRRDFLRSVCFQTAGPAFAGSAKALAAATRRRPNVLLVIGDDMAWNDCEPYGSPDVQTPNMARLAREGMCFDAMFTSTAMCAPTRQQLYTGLYPVRNGAYPNHSRVYDGVRSIVHHLGDLGYRVGLIGKTHFKPRASFPFENLGELNDAECWGRIRAFVQRDTNQPYMLIFASHEPHGPWNRGDQSPYNPAKLTVPPYLVDCPETRTALQKYYAEITTLDDQLGRCMNIVDTSGRRDDTILIFTSEQGSGMPLAGKWTCYDTGLKTVFILRWPKRVRGGTRTSAMAQYVDVAPTLIEAAGGNPDRCNPGRPDALGKEGFDGRSFLPVLLGQTDKHRQHVYGVHTTRGIIRGSGCYPIRSVRSRRYKYIRNLNHTATFYNVVSTDSQGLLEAWKRLGKTDPAAAARARWYQHRPAEELYDVTTDPYELKNLADDPSLAKIKSDLATKLDAWMAQQGDEGIATELQANERQGATGNKTWKPYDPQNPPAPKAPTTRPRRQSQGRQ